MCPYVKQNEIQIDIYIYSLLIEDLKHTWKWTCTMHGLYVLWKENHLNLHVFSIELTLLQFDGNFMISSYNISMIGQLLNQIECILGFLMYP
jgi:hypothetical protein